MNKIILLVSFFILNITILKAQEINNLNNKWAFSGSRTTFFTVKNDTLFLSLIDDNDIDKFEPLYLGKPNFDILTLFPCKITQFNDKLMIVAEISDGRKETIMTFIYSNYDSTKIHYVGNVYYNDDRIPKANKNCNLDVPSCSIKLYTLHDFKKIRNLKSIAEISKMEVLKIFNEHEEILKTKCNKCYEGFPGADINQIIIEMGYNPILKVDWNSSYAYDVSGFDNIMDIYGEDEEVNVAYRKYFSAFINDELKNE